MSDNTIEKLTFDIDCENCGSKIEKSIGWLKMNDELTCTCGTVISLQRDEALNAIAGAERELAKFIKAVNKTFK